MESAGGKEPTGMARAEVDQDGTTAYDAAAPVAEEAAASGETAGKDEAQAAPVAQRPTSVTERDAGAPVSDAGETAGTR